AVKVAFQLNDENFEMKWDAIYHALVQLRRDIIASKCMKYADESQTDNQHQIQSTENLTDFKDEEDGQS
ncbi:unnamed protein product, partial [Didymodactylos carnosus]